MTDEVNEHVEELKDWFKERNLSVEGEVFEEDLKDLLFDYGVFVNPRKEELQEFNVSKGLDESAYISDLFSQKNEPAKNTGKPINRSREMER